MVKEKTALHQRIESGKSIVVAEIAPPTSSDPEPIRRAARKLVGKVHAIGVSDNRDGVSMSALAAASFVVAEGVEPILHTVTRDRNRIALISDCLGAAALNIRNLLCNTGTHQTLGRAKSAKNVFDVDSTQLINIISHIETDASIVGEEKLDGAGPFCLGAVASPYADPLELQIIRLLKKVDAGAHFLITQPVFDMDRFEVWWEQVTESGIHEKVAILAGIQILTDGETARDFAARRPSPRVPDALIGRIESKTDDSAQRAEGIEIAAETVRRLSSFKGLRGFEICGGGDEDAVLELIEKTDLRVE